MPGSFSGQPPHSPKHTARRTWATGGCATQRATLHARVRVTYSSRSRATSTDSVVLGTTLPLASRYNGTWTPSTTP